MKQHLKTGYYLLQKVLQKDVRLLGKIRREDLIVVLNLHQISPHQNPFWPPLKPDIFDDLLAFLKVNFKVVTFEEIEKTKCDKPLAVLSFDDGYYNFFEFAVPILNKHGLRANLNIIPSCVENAEPMWNIKLYDFLNSAPRKLIDQISLSGFEHRLRDESSSAKLRYGLQISRFLKLRPRTEREELWPQIEDLIKNWDFCPTRMMNVKEIREIAEIHEIGAHSFSHDSMEFEDNAFFANDFEKCADYFRNKLELPLGIYAFPNGSYRHEQVEMLRNRGIKHILLVGEAYAQKAQGVYPRFTIYGSSKFEVRLRALGFNRKL